MKKKNLFVVLAFILITINSYSQIDLTKEQ